MGFLLLVSLSNRRSCSNVIVAAVIEILFDIEAEPHLNRSVKQQQQQQLSHRCRRTFSQPSIGLVCARVYRDGILYSIHVRYICIVPMVFICCVQTASFKVAQYSFDFVCIPFMLAPLPPAFCFSSV